MTVLNRVVGWIEERPLRAATLARWATQAVNLVGSLAVVPLLFHHFGSDVSGLWFFMVSWTGAFLLLDLGFSQGLTRQIAYAQGEEARTRSGGRTKFLQIRGDRASLAAFASGRRHYRRIALASFLIATLVERTVLFADFADVPLDVRITWYLISFGVCGTLLARPYLSLLEGTLLPSWQQVSLLLATVIGRGGMIVVLAAGLPLWAAGAVFCLGNWAQFAFSAAFCARRYPDSSGTGTSPKRRLTGFVWSLSWQQGIGSVGVYCTFMVNPILIGYFLSASAVSDYFVPWRIANALEMAINALIIPQLGFLIKYISDNKPHAALGRFFFISTITVGLAIVCFSLYAVFGRFIVEILSSGKVTVSDELLLVFAVHHVLAIMQYACAIFIISHGLQPFAVVHMAGAVANALLALLLIPQLGVLGSALGTLIATTITSNWFVYFYFFRVLRRYRGEVTAPEVWSGVREEWRRQLRGLPGLRRLATRGEK